jgi:hypothetical protein
VEHRAGGRSRYPSHSGPDLGGYLDEATRLRRRGTPAAARVVLERAVALAQAAPGADRLQLVGVRRMLGEVLCELGDPAAAFRVVSPLVRETEHEFGHRHPATVRTVAVLGAVVHELGELDTAERMYQRVVDVAPQVGGPTMMRSASLARVRLAMLHRDRGDLRAALDELTSAFQAHRERYGTEDADTVHIGAELAALHRAVGDRASARRVLTVSYVAAAAGLGEANPLTRRLERELAELEPPMPSAPVDLPDDAHSRSLQRRHDRRAGNRRKQARGGAAARAALTTTAERRALPRQRERPALPPPAGNGSWARWPESLTYTGEQPVVRVDRGGGGVPGRGGAYDVGGGGRTSSGTAGVHGLSGAHGAVGPAGAHGMPGAYDAPDRPGALGGARTPSGPAGAYGPPGAHGAYDVSGATRAPVEAGGAYGRPGTHDAFGTAGTHGPAGAFGGGGAPALPQRRDAFDIPDGPDAAASTGRADPLGHGVPDRTGRSWPGGATVTDPDPFAGPGGWTFAEQSTVDTPGTDLEPARDRSRSAALPVVARSRPRRAAVAPGRRSTGMRAIAATALVVGAAMAVAGSLALAGVSLSLPDRSPDSAALAPSPTVEASPPPPSPSPSPSSPPASPVERPTLTIRDEGATLIVSWKLSTPAAVTVGLIEPPKEDVRPVATVPAGTTTHNLRNLDRRRNYCVLVRLTTDPGPPDSGGIACTRR